MTTPSAEALEQFEKWWATKVAEGYQYGDGPLATVRFGFTAGFAAAIDAAGPQNGFWPTLRNRGDGVDGHYCIGRLVNVSEPYWEYWNQGKWVSAGELFIGKENAETALLFLRAMINPATRIQQLLVAKELQFREALNDARPQGECVWTPATPPFADWATSCGNAYYLDEEDSPTKARMSYCMFCGKKLVEKENSDAQGIA